jgi:hypothetical protein
MDHTKKTVTTWLVSESDKAQADSVLMADLAAKQTDMINRGLYDGTVFNDLIVDDQGNNIRILTKYWLDQAAAEEWVSYVTAKDAEHNIDLISIVIADIT